MLETAVDHPTRRRALWIAIPTIGAAGALWWQWNIGSPEQLPASTSADVVLIAEFSDSGQRKGVTRISKTVRSDSDWWTRLTPQQYYVTRKHSTDEPYSGTYYRLHEDGIFRCVCCQTALFSSKTKYDSGTGWPSFWAPIAIENIRTVDAPDLSQQEALLSGIEVLCKRCDAHLGHIFGDGPAPTNLRYCINESALRFLPRVG